jgi:hypothetical protein
MPLVDPNRTDLDLESLLPAVYRLQDEPRKRPLGSLLEVIGEQAGLVKRNIDDLLDDFFIETCADWVIPYIGDLVGNTILPGRIRRPRADVAKTIYYRRRKGTLPMLEELARDVTLWRAHAAPFFELANWTQHINHLRFAPQPEPRPPRPRGGVGTASVRDPETAELVDGPFDVTSHSVDVRPVARREGWPALRRVGFFLWRLSAYPVEGVTPAEGPKPNLFHFNPVGIDAPLFTTPEREAEETELAEEIHVPAPIRRLAFHRQRDAYYGQSVTVYDGVVAGDATEIPAQRVVGRNLEAWLDPASQPQPGDVAVDVRLGRLAFNEADVPNDVRVSYAYGFSADIGGGPYPREVERGLGLWTATVRQAGGAEFTSVQDALGAWAAVGRQGVITILDSATYEETLSLSVPASTALTIQAADRVRPHLRPPGGIAVEYGGDPAALRRSELTLSGLLVEGGVKLGKRTLGALHVVHSTLVPGTDPSIVAADPNDRLRVQLESSICGAIRMPAESRGLFAADSIIDAAAPGVQAIGSPQSAAAYGPMVTLERVTVLGAVRCREVRLASETIFTDLVTSQRRQAGCVRFSYVPPKSLTPRRYRCQPDLALEHDPPPAERQRILLRLRPQFTAVRYGLPAYGQLGETCPREIRTGAENGGEMGAFNTLEQPQRESNLRLRLDEYMPFGLDPGLIHVT